MKCRACNNKLKFEFADLEFAPPSNSFLKKEELELPEVFYPLKLFVCNSCYLVQVDEYKKSSEIFSSDYVYFSSYSKSWLEHSEKYSKMITERFSINKDSQVVEIASNDGYLLQYFLKKGIKVLGIEPSSSTAIVARSKGINTIEEFFGEDLANTLVKENSKADLLIGNNVIAHVPDIIDFVKGIKIILKEEGIATFEFPHLLNLIKFTQFDTIYHEHFSYISIIFLKNFVEKYGLEIFDIEEIITHGGSLRVYLKHIENKKIMISKSVSNILEKEIEFKLNELSYYTNFQDKINKIKYALLEFLLESKKQKKVIVGYGAAAKGNTLLNFCGIKKDLLSCVIDRALSKQGKFLPGSHIPVYNEEYILNIKPDYIIIFPWNILEELKTQLEYTKEWGCKLVTVIPEFKVS
ncbi:MAG: class I SAM-dependent methyltransferase [Leptospiraceae bacterium]|nr:class I SAM-dependent methyltransferase [Leptospiraceae bacterium]